MRDRNVLSSADQELEHQLSQLTPACHGINRDALMFRAGQQAARKKVQPWRSAAWILMGVVVGLGAQVVVPSGRAPQSTVAVSGSAFPSQSNPSGLRPPIQAMMPAFAASWSANMDYLRLRDLVTTLGVDALPVSDWAAPSDVTPALIGAGSLRSAPDQGRRGRWNWNAQENGDQS